MPPFRSLKPLGVPTLVLNKIKELLPLGAIPLFYLLIIHRLSNNPINNSSVAHVFTLLLEFDLMLIAASKMKIEMISSVIILLIAAVCGKINTAIKTGISR